LASVNILCYLWVYRTEHLCTVEPASPSWHSSSKLKRKLVSCSRDDEGDWRAALECGHYQHVRHDPPLITREWVTTDEGRASRIGSELECRKCDEGSPPDF